MTSSSDFLTFTTQQIFEATLSVPGHTETA